MHCDVADHLRREGIDRVSLTRSKPMRRSATKKRKPKARCSWSNRCPRRPGPTGLCQTHAMWRAKQIVGDRVKARDGRCVLQGFNASPCLGALQWAHLIPQGRYPSLRFVESNSIAACLRHHAAFDFSPVERELWCRRNLGERYEALQMMVIRKERGPTAAEVIEEERQ